MIVYVFCQGFNTKPSGGVKVLFDIVNLLNKSNWKSKILIPNGEYKINWLDYEVEIENNPDKVTSQDIMVFHEETLWMFDKIVGRTGCKYIILNQGAHWSLTNYLGYNRTKEIYQNALGVLVNSVHTGLLVDRLFGQLKQYRFHIGIPEYFKPSQQKANTIAYMPRRNSETAECIAQYVKDVHSNWSVIAINDMHQKQVADVLSLSKIFLSFGGPEGFGLPPLEAALGGCKVIGYHGFGGEEFFKQPVFTSIPFMDIPLFLDTINEYVSLLNNKQVLEIGKASEQITYLRNTYSKERFESDIINAFTEMIK